MKPNYQINPIDILTRLIGDKMSFSTRAYSNGGEMVLEIFAIKDSVILKHQFPKIFDIGHDSRGNVIAKAVFIL